MWAAALSVSADEIRIGVLAKRGEVKALDRWSPLASYLQERIPQHDFRIVPMQFDEIPGLVDNNLVQFVIVNSAIYVDLAVRYGVRRILTLENRNALGRSLTRFGSTLVARADNPEPAHLVDMAGKRVAAVHATSLGGWLMIRDELESRGIGERDLKQVLFTNTHDAVIEAVISERVDAGIVRSDTLERMISEGKIDAGIIRVIDDKSNHTFPFKVTSRLYPEWPIATTRATPDAIAKQVSNHLLALPADHPAAVAAKISGWTIPEEYQPVHELLRRLRVPPYEEYGKLTLESLVQDYWEVLLAIGLAILIMALLLRNLSALNRKLLLRSRQLERSQEAFRATFEQAAVGFANISASGEFLRANRRLCSLAEQSESELRQKNFIDIIYPEDAHKLIQGLEELRRQSSRQFSAEVRIVDRNGNRRWTSISLAPSWSSSDRIKHIIAVVDDIDELKQLHLNLDRESQQKELILNMAGDGILGLHPDATHSFCNPVAAALLGYEIEELIGQDSHSLWHHTREDGSPYPSAECPITSVLKKGITHRGNNELLWRKDGSSFRADFISTPIIEEGAITGAVVLFHAHSNEIERSVDR
ncbi:MAG: PhnD/SsuA/transferrin family substrate-binding protein [Sedimenticola sp.]